MPFVEYAAFRAVQVLRAVPVEDSPAEADDSPRHVVYREHHPAAETVVAAAVPSRQRQAAFDRLFFGYSPASQVSRKRIPRGRAQPISKRAASACVIERRSRYFLAASPSGAFIDSMKNSSAALLASALARGVPLPGRLDSVTPASPLGVRVLRGIRGALFLHDERKNVPALAAAEAVKCLPLRRHGERRRLFIMKRTAPPNRSALSF